MPSFKTEAPPYKPYGDLIHAWRNEIKHPLSTVAKELGIPIERLKELEKGYAKPEWEELEKLAKHFFVGVRDLLPLEDDLDRGMKFLRHQNARAIDQEREGRLQYTYWSRVMSSVLPNVKPIELLLHLTRREDVVMNRGHFFHQYTQVLHGGPVAYLWEWQGGIHEEVFQEGDSWLIPGFTSHAFYSPDPNRLGRILAITFGQHLTGDARQELSLIGKDNVTRIIQDDKDYYPKGEKV